MQAGLLNYLVLRPFNTATTWLSWVDIEHARLTVVGPAPIKIARPDGAIRN
jgi:hypothetical protein